MWIADSTLKVNGYFKKFVHQNKIEKEHSYLVHSYQQTLKKQMKEKNIFFHVHECKKESMRNHNLCYFESLDSLYIYEVWVMTDNLVWKKGRWGGGMLERGNIK